MGSVWIILRRELMLTALQSSSYWNPHNPCVQSLGTSPPLCLTLPGGAEYTHI